MNNLKSFRSFALPVKLLVVNQMAVNAGFYMLVPFLAMYFTEDLGLSLAVTGIILGARNLSQQGLFLVGGAASDRLGTRPVIITGCGLRVIGFGLFALGDNVALLIAGSIISGFAGALFNPAVRVYVAAAAGERRSEAFALFNVFAQAGALLGPIIGTSLLVFDFRIIAVTAALLFLVLTIAQLFALPPQDIEKSQDKILTDLGFVMTHRQFLLFTLALVGLYTLESQMYLTFPVLLKEATGLEQTVMLLFLGTTIASIVFQVRINAWFSRKMTRDTSITIGMTIMGISFLPLLAILGTQSENTNATIAIVAIAIGSAIAMQLGAMIAQPFVLEMIPEFGPKYVSGMLFGTFYLASGLVAAGGNSLIGWGIDYREGHLGIIMCTLIGIASAALYAVFSGRRLFPQRPITLSAERTSGGRSRIRE